MKGKTQRKARQRPAPAARPIGDADVERELLTALYIGWGRKEVAYAFEKLTKKDFLMDEHGQLFLEYRDAHDAGAPVDTPALLKEWLTRNGGLKRLMRAGWHDDERAAVTWIFAMYFDCAGLPCRIPYYCHVLRRYRIERAMQTICALKDADELATATQQLGTIDRLTDWSKAC